MNIMATDEVSFLVSFRPGSKPTAASATGVGEDYFECKLTQSSDDPRFWEATISDGYYKCEAPGGAADYGFGADDHCDGFSYSN